MSFIGEEHAHVPFALIEKWSAEPSAFFEQDDFLVRQLSERAGQHAAGGAGADDQNVAGKRSHDVALFLTSGPAYPIAVHIASIE